MKSLKKAALDFNPVLDVISPTLPHSASQIYEPVAQSDHIEETHKKWHQLMLNWNNYLNTAITQLLNKQDKAHAATTPLPIIKATTQFNKTQIDLGSIDTHEQLLGQTVLCVGGRACLYSEYYDAIRALGGNLLTFHGNVNDSIERLYTLLSQADMVICPIDCVRHDLFFAVKHFCKYTNKPYALLDRSEINTFRKGIEALVQHMH